MSELIILNNESESVKYLIKKDKRLAKIINMVGEITYRPYEDSYSFLVNEIIGQMLSNKVGDIIFGRLMSLCNGKVTPEKISLLSDEEIKSTGTSNSKIKFIRELTNAVNNGTLDFERIKISDDKTAIRKLTSVYGLGNWTAKMYLIFVLNRMDILPFEDAAFLQTYNWAYKPKDVLPASIKKKCKKWSPYSSIAARYMYRALDMGLTKSEFHLYK